MAVRSGMSCMVNFAMSIPAVSKRQGRRETVKKAYGAYVYSKLEYIISTVVLYGCETWSPTLGEEHRLTVRTGC
jgi:hypothetical protein